MNKIELLGRIGNDLELKGEGEKQYIRFNLAVRKGKDETDWFNCTAFGKNANTIFNWCEKGSQVAIIGKMVSSKKDEKIYWGVNVDEVDIIDFKKKEEAAEQPKPQYREEKGGLSLSPDALPFY